MGINVRDGIPVSGNLSSFCKFVDNPHPPTFRPQKLNHNHCADADPRDKKPFCYTTDPEKRWEYCECKTSCVPPETTPPPIKRKCCSEVTKTESGRLCQRWSDQSPHNHGQSLPSGSQDSWHGFCRNPGKESANNQKENICNFIANS